MIIQIGDGRVLHAHFRHLGVEVRSTECWMHWGPCQRPNRAGSCLAVIVGGLARCSVRDTFCKATGRKLAFTRALRALTERTALPKEARREVWRAYLTQAGVRVKDAEPAAG